jgi:hypothetical protein
MWLAMGQLLMGVDFNLALLDSLIIFNYWA